jgi:tRNA dimethylallyltransferase
LGADATGSSGAIAELVRLARETPLVAIVGPTASGKTALACALAERIDGEVISADSVQVYRRFDIGSGKPSAAELARARHHLVDVCDPGEPFDAAQFADLASAAIADVRARGKYPIVCGGTYLWVKALLQGLAEAPPASAELRARHAELVAESGRSALHDRLREVDPASAARLHPNDTVRVGRALEVFELTGRTMTAIHAAHAFRTTRHEGRVVAPRVGPDALTARIAARVGGWLAAGWVDEVARLAEDGYSEARAMGSVGYREVHAHVRGELSGNALADAIVRATRVFARRQRTWLNSADVVWLET